MTEPSPTPAQMAGALRPKLAKRLLKCAYDAVPWDDAMKSHRQLEALGLVLRGSDGEQDVALGSSFGQAVAKELEGRGG